MTEQEIEDNLRFEEIKFRWLQNNMSGLYLDDIAFLVNQVEYLTEKIKIAQRS